MPLTYTAIKQTNYNSMRLDQCVTDIIDVIITITSHTQLITSTQAPDAVP